MSVLSVAALLSVRAAAAQGKEPALTQTVPDAVTEPRLFAEGIVSTPADEFGATFSRDGRTVLFSRSVPRSNLYLICEATFRDGRWTEPRIASFSGRYWDFDPVFTPDGSKVLFASDRPVPGKEKADKDFDLWVVERTATGSGSSRWTPRSRHRRRRTGRWSDQLAAQAEATARRSGRSTTRPTRS